MAVEPDPGIARLSAAVDEVVVPAGFSTAQSGSSAVPRRSVALLWCAASFDVAAEFPSLARALALGPLEQSAVECTDLVVEVLDDRGTWRSARLDLEGRDVGDVLNDLGDIASTEIAWSLVGAPVGECAAQLPGLLRRMLELGAAPVL